MNSPPQKNAASDTPPDEPAKAAEEQKLIEGPKREPDIKIVVMEPVKEPTKHAGRPIEYSEKVADKIVDLLLDGKSLSKIGETEGLPSTRTIARWRLRFPEFDKLCIQAYHLSVQMLDDRALGEIPDMPSDDLSVQRLTLDRHRVAVSEIRRQAMIEHANRRAGHSGSLSAPVENTPGDGAKVIDLAFEVVETPDDPRFEDCLKKWESVTGLKSKQTLREEAAIEPKQD